MLINQKVSKIYKSDEALFVRTVFETSITFPHLNTELSIILFTSTCSMIPNIIFFVHDIHLNVCSHTNNYRYSTSDLKYDFYYWLYCNFYMFY